MGSFLSLDNQYFVENKKTLDRQTDWYKELVFGIGQRWRMFGKPSRSSYRFAIEILEDDTWKEYKFITIRDDDPINRHRNFKLLRNLAESNSRKKKAVYLQDVCERDSIPNNTRIRLRKYWQKLPSRKKSVDYDWNTWDPKWKTRVVKSIRCTS